MRFFKFLAFFLIITGAIYLFVVGTNFNVFKTVFTNQEALAEGSEWVEKTFSLSGMTDFIAAHDSLVSVVMYPVGGDSDTISFQAHVPRAMGSSGHLFILLAYGNAVDKGTLRPDSLISVQQLDRFVVPGFEPNRHKESLRLLDRSERVENGETELDNFVHLMIIRNHQPSADLLYTLLGKEAIAEQVRLHVGEETEIPALWSAFHLNTVINGYTTETHPTHEQRQQFASEYKHFAASIMQEGRKAGDLLKDSGISRVNHSFFEEKYAYRWLPQIKAMQMAGVLENIYFGTHISDGAREVVMRHLNWPMNDPKLTRDFTDFNAIFDSRIAVSNGVVIGTSVYTGRTYVSAVYFDQLPIGFWMHMSSNLINQDLQMRLIYDPAMFERAQTTLNTSQN